MLHYLSHPNSYVHNRKFLALFCILTSYRCMELLLPGRKGQIKERARRRAKRRRRRRKRQKHRTLSFQTFSICASTIGPHDYRKEPASEEALLIADAIISVASVEVGTYPCAPLTIHARCNSAGLRSKIAPCIVKQVQKRIKYAQCDLILFDWMYILYECLLLLRFQSTQPHS